MRLRITLGELPWEGWNPKGDPAHLTKLRQRLHELFAAYGPKRLSEKPTGMDYCKHEMTVAADDPAVEKLLEAFDKEVRKVKPNVAGMVEAELSPDEVPRARWLERLVLGDRVDVDAKGKPTNAAESVLCTACGFPDIGRVPEPFRVAKAALKKQDVLATSRGVLVVRPDALALLRGAIGDQIEVGEVVVEGSKGKAGDADRLSWVRPRQVIGAELDRRLGETCKACKRVLGRWSSMTSDYMNARGPGVHDKRRRLEHFGTGGDLAVLGGFSESIKDDPHMGRRWSWPVAISGALFTHLKSNGVKGIVVGSASDPVKPYFSRKQEATLEQTARTFGGGAPAPKGAAQAGANGAAKAGKKAGPKVTAAADAAAAAAALKDLPWDCGKDGYVYFQRTTPQLAAFDPMTWEEDSSGPYKVKGFKRPGLYRLHVSAIKEADGEGRGLAVDAATLLLVDGAFAADLQETYEWERATDKKGALARKYHDEVAAKIGSRFAVCTPPARKFKSAFVGDGIYTIDVTGVERVEE